MSITYEVLSHDLRKGKLVTPEDKAVNRGLEEQAYKKEKLPI